MGVKDRSEDATLLALKVGEEQGAKDFRQPLKLGKAESTFAL